MKYSGVLASVGVWVLFDACLLHVDPWILVLAVQNITNFHDIYENELNPPFCVTWLCRKDPYHVGIVLSPVVVCCQNRLIALVSTCFDGFQPNMGHRYNMGALICS